MGAASAVIATNGEAPSMSYKLLIFDFDGTLADSFPWFVRIINQVAEKYRFRRIEDAELDTLRSLEARHLIRHLRIPVWKMPFIACHVKRLMAREIHQIALFEGIPELLRQLSERGVRLAMVSSNSVDNIRRVLGPEIAGLFQYYECGGSIFGKKAKFLKVLKLSGVSQHEALCIGDELRDLEAARRARIPFGAVSWGFTTEEALRAQSPTTVFSSLDGIAALGA